MEAIHSETFMPTTAIGPQASYRELLQAARRLRRTLKGVDSDEAIPGLIATRLAIVGNSTLSFLADPLMVHLANRGVQANLTLGGYGGYQSEILDPTSKLLAEPLDFLIIHLDHHAVNQWPSLNDSEEQCIALAAEQVAQWSLLWKAAHEATGCTIIQTNLAIPPERALGACESSSPTGRIHFLRRINALLAASLPDHALLCDAEHLSGVVGKREWFDLPHWYASRQAVQFDALGEMADNLACLIASQLGRSRKCLVLDLDNTLWGGVVGDVGREGLRLQRGDAVGEAYLDFQAYCLRLKQRGVLLAVCSKNEEVLAKDVFEHHPEMILGIDDISVFVANWQDKASNLQRIAQQLNIGLDALVFVDDNPAERELVRQLAPQVAVPELPTDPACYVRTVDSHNYFETAQLSSEDLARADQYNAQRARGEAAASFADLDSFLRSLEQRCEIASLNKDQLQRAVQLINKTNQFNLTTVRRTAGELEQWYRDSTHLVWTVRHGDRFGDNGIISVLHGRLQSQILVIEDWVLSCRVFNRGIEDCVFNELVSACERRGLTAIHGVYRPTERNQVVAGLYQRLGMVVPVERAGEAGAEDGCQLWTLASLPNYPLRPHTLECHTRISELASCAKQKLKNPHDKEAGYEPRVA